MFKLLQKIAYYLKVAKPLKFVATKTGLYKSPNENPVFWDNAYKSGYHSEITQEHSYVRHNIICSTIKSLGTENSRIFDVGCGSGVLRQAIDFPFLSYYGMDFSSEAISIAIKEKYLHSEFLVKKVEEFDVPCHSFDVIIFNEVLYYIDNYIYEFKRYFEFLNSNGILIISMVLNQKSESIFKHINKLIPPIMTLECDVQRFDKAKNVFRIAVFRIDS